MGRTARAIERLTTIHTVHYDSREYECAPLIDQLYEARTSSLGAGSSPTGRSLDAAFLNLAALTLWEHIDGVAR